MNSLRYAFRQLLKNPGFTVVAVLTLALGIGANTAIFSVVNGILFKSLSYREADRLVTVLHEDSGPVAPADFNDWREQNQSFDFMAAAEGWGPIMTGGEHAMQTRGLRLTDDMFALLGIQPLLGRSFDPENFGAEENSLVISHSFWKNRLGADPEVIGQTVTLDEKSFTIIGVMPPEFRFAPFWIRDAEIWGPLHFGDRRHRRMGNSLRVFARLKDGVAVDAAQADMSVIAQRLAEEAIGKRVLIWSQAPREVVGVVGDIKQSALSGATRPHVYMPLAQVPGPRLFLAVRTASNPTQVAGAVHEAIWSVDKELAVEKVRTMGQLISGSIAQPRFSMVLLGCFAATAVLLAAIGIYGVISYSVTRRTHEIGIRMTLGARGSDVLELVLRQGMTMTLVGASIGVVGAFAVTRLMSSLLYDISPTDPTIFVGVSLVLIMVAFAACYLPARRAAKVDPMEALRRE
jgi:hypothetical protein